MMKNYKLIKRVAVIAIFAVHCLSSYSQAVVTDPTSMAQRIVLFLEEIEESVSQGMDLAESNESISRLVELSKESAEKLQKVSDFVKTSRQMMEITESELRIADKMSDYVKRVRQMNTLSAVEKENIIASLLKLSAEAAKRVKEGVDLVKSGSSDANLSDYERMQLLSELKDEVLIIEDSIDRVYEMGTSKISTNSVINQLNEMTFMAMTFQK